MSNPKVSVIIPCRNEADFIEQNVKSFLSQDYDGELEILVVDGMSDDGTREIVLNLSDANPQVVLVDNPQRVTPIALNIGVEKSTGEYFVIVGGHAYAEPDFISQNVSILTTKPEVACAGGLINNIELNETSKFISRAMASRFGVGNATFRTGGKEGYVDTVAFGMYRKSIVDSIGVFDEDLVRNQDDEFNFRLTKSGAKVYFSPDVQSNYYVRGDFQKLFRQYYQYGYWKVYVNKKHKQITTLRQVFPSLLVAGTVLGTALSFVHILFAWITFSVLSLYFLLAVLFAASAARSVKEFFGVYLSFLILHTSYGTGYLIGIFELLLLGKNPSNRVTKTSRA